tara:strand:- start:29 stop:406 length:378 start_codon:yes stop_codon:yes gene_type:complete
MAFPTIEPSSRTFDPGNYPVKTFTSQSGTETRILYGSNRTNMKLSLTYANISDAVAQQFLTHYDDVQGTFQTFSVLTETKSGWSGNADAFSAAPQSNRYRYEGPPQVAQVRPGISTVTVSLIGVL